MRILLIFILLHCYSTITAKDLLLSRRALNASQRSALKNPVFDKTGPDGSILVSRNNDYVKYTPEELVKKLFVKEGALVTIENVQFKGNGWDGKKWNDTVEIRSLSYFNKGTSNFPIEEGLLLSTTNGREAEGPNSNGYGMNGGISLDNDKDLRSLLQGTQFITSGAILEFDFIANTTGIEFKYIFASEEYPEFVNTPFNDIFGFFISAADEPLTNIARLPDTETGLYEVSINNVNNGHKAKNENLTAGKDPSNSKYFIPNIEKSIVTEFDGYTVVLTATHKNLVPGKKYHLKLGVANVSEYDEFDPDPDLSIYWDDSYGSGVFLQARSFDAGMTVENYNQNTITNEITGGCTDNKLVFTRTNTAGEQTLQIQYKGTAVNGTDYIKKGGGSLPTSITFAAGSSKAEIPYEVTNIGENKTFILNVNFYGTSVEKNITLYKAAKIKSVQASPITSGNTKGSITVTGEGGSGKYQYAINSGSWVTDNYFDNLAAGEYTVNFRDVNGCTVDTKKVTIENQNTTGLTIENYVNSNIAYDVIAYCTDNKLIFTRTNTANEQTLNIEYKGTAANGTDYIKKGGGSLPANITFAAGSNKVEIPYEVTGISANKTLIVSVNFNGTPVEKTINLYKAATIKSIQVSYETSGDVRGSITVIGDGGLGEYEYSLNSGSWTTNNHFENLAPGTYTVSLRDINGCTVNKKTAIIEGDEEDEFNIENYAKNSVTYDVVANCADNKLVFSRTATTNEQTLHIEYGGTAVNGSDYITPGGGRLPSTITFYIGDDKIEIPYEVTGIDENKTLIPSVNFNGTPVKKTINLYKAATIDAIQVTHATSEYLKGSITVTGEGGSGRYEYAINSENWTTANYFGNLNPGTYTVNFRDVNGCTTDSQTVTIEGENISVHIPNTFTPNGDGYNDVFMANCNACELIQVFDRQGKKLYEGAAGWDGFYKNKFAGNDTYFYVITINNNGQRETKKGYVTIMGRK